METTYYTLTAREIIVSGDGISAAVGAPARQRPTPCLPGGTGPR